MQRTRTNLKFGKAEQEGKKKSCAALEKQSEILINEYMTNIDQSDYKGFAGVLCTFNQ